MGSSKVKLDGLDSRLQSGLDRIERASAERAREADTEAQLRLGQLSGDAGRRLEVLESRLDALEDECEETVEKALERRLALLSGADAGFQMDRDANRHRTSSF